MDRNDALRAAQERRETESRRLVAHLDPNAPAKTPVPTVEPAEPSPYDKFGGHTTL